jgi:hypothetical protein
VLTGCILRACGLLSLWRSRALRCSVSDWASRARVSYARADAIVSEIRKGLEEANVEVVRDLDHIALGEQWPERLRQLIDEADSVVLVLSQRSATSAEVAKELAYARDAPAVQ